MTRQRRAASVLAILLLAACSVPNVAVDPPPPSNPYESERRAAVETLLHDWADAVRSSDSAALTALTDSAAPPGFLQQQIDRSVQVAASPLADWGYELVDEPETPVPSEVAEPLNATDVWAPSVVLRYAIQGADDLPTRRPVSLLVAERDGRWRLVSDSDIAGIDRHTWRGPWDFGSVTSSNAQTSGGASVVVGHPEQATLMSAIVDELPAAVDAVSDFWGEEWARKAVIFTAGSPAEFVASVGTAAAGADAAAVTISDLVVPDRPVSGQRVVFGPTASERLTEFTTRSVLRHELTHVATRSNTVDGSPMWMLEGIADYSGYRGSGLDLGRLAPTLSRAVARGGPPTVLPTNADFAAGGLRATLAYESAWSVSAFVAQRFGEPTLRALYLKIADGPKSDGEVSAVLTAVLGLGIGDFVADWGAWVAAGGR